MLIAWAATAQLTRKGNADFLPTNKGSRRVRTWQPTSGQWKLTALGKRYFTGADSEFVISPTSKDVISARGCGRSHAGNVRFRNLITQNKHAYDSNSSEEFRRSLALKVANEIKPGRFLKKDTNQEVYKVMPFEKMITKITFAMRDCKSHVSMGRRKAFETTRTKATVAPRQKRKAAPKTKSE